MDKTIRIKTRSDDLLALTFFELFFHNPSENVRIKLAMMKMMMTTMWNEDRDDIVN